MKNFYAATPIASCGQTFTQRTYGFFTSHTRMMVLMICLLAGLWRSGEMKGQTTITIGTGTTSAAPGTAGQAAGAAGASPYGISASGANGKKLQIIYTYADINAAMIAAGYPTGSSFIHSIAWDISANTGGTYNSGYQNYTIKIANVAQSQFTGTGNAYTGSMTTVWGPSSNTFQAGTGFMTTPFSLGTPFQWDGSSNLLLEVCWNNTASGGASSYGGCRRTNTSNNQMIYNGGASVNCSTSSYTQVVAAIPNMRVNVTSATPCAGVPDEAQAGSATVCAGVSTNIGLTDLPGASGYSYLWKQASSIGGPYTAASGTNTNSSYNTPTTLPYNPTYYICEVTCDNSSEMTPSLPGTVSLNSFLNCYCAASYQVALGTGQNNRGIVNVGLNGTPAISNASSANGTYSLYTAAAPVANAGLTVNQPYTLAVTVGSQTGTNNNVRAWIDYNQNGVFESGETVGATSALSQNATGNINFTVDPGATPGLTMMRIRHRFANTIAATDACTNFGTTQTNGGSGETEDYYINIIAGCEAPETSASASSASPINTTSVTLNWTNGDGDAGRVVVLRQGSAVNSGPVGGTAYTANSVFGSGDELGTDNYIVYNSNGSSASISNLLPSTTYHYEIFEYHSDGTCYQIDGHTGSFTTASCAPSTNATSLTYSEITNVSATANWVRGSGTHVLVVARLTATTRVFPAYNTTYTTNTNFGSGSGSAITGTGNFVVYNGTGTSVNVTGLANNTGYTFDVYEYNASPNCYWFTTPLNEVLTTLDGTMSGGCAATVVRTTGAGQYTSITPTTTLQTGNLTNRYFQGGAANTPGSGIPIGFDFVYNDVTYTSFGLCTNGFIWFGSGVPNPATTNPISNASANLGGSGTIDGIIAVAGTAVNSGGGMFPTTNDIGYRVDGVAPDRVLTIQWRGYRLSTADLSSTLCGLLGYSDINRLDFQIKLHENGGTNSNKIQLAYADMNSYCIESNSCSAQVGLRGADNTSFTNRTGNANGSWANTAGTVNSATCTMGNSNYISGNVLLTFTQALTTPPVVNVGTQTCPDVTVPLTAPASSSYQWFLNGNIVPGPGSSAQTLDAAESGNYTVVAKVGTCYLQSDLNAVVVTSCGPTIDTQPSPETTGCTVGITSFTVAASGATNYQWQISTNGGGTWTNVSNGGKYSGATTATLNISNPTIAFSGNQYQVIVSDASSNSVTSDASVLTVQVCPPNDNPGPSNPNMNAVAHYYPYQVFVQGTTTNATVSPQTGTADVWYQFNAISNGVRIVVNSSVIDPEIRLCNSSYEVIDTETLISGTGTERLNYGGLTPGQNYFVAVSSASVNQGTFNIAIQKLRTPACGAGAPYSLCTAFKSTSTGATTTQYSFAQGLDTTSFSAPGPFTLSTPALQLLYGNTYSVGITASYVLDDGDGQSETILVPNMNACTINIGAQPSIEVRSNQRCANGATLYRSSYLQASPVGVGVVCGITGYLVEFTPVSNCLGENPDPLMKIERTISGSAATIVLSTVFNELPLSINPNIGYWSVVWTPIFHGNILGTPSTTARVIGVNGTSASNMEPETDSLNGLITSDNVSTNIYPNPNNGDMVNLNMTGITTPDVFVRIMDGMGRVVYTNRYVVDGSLNTIVSFSKPLTSGLYMVEFTTGNEVRTQRMMVAK